MVSLYALSEPVLFQSLPVFSYPPTMHCNEEPDCHLQRLLSGIRKLSLGPTPSLLQHANGGLKVVMSQTPSAIDKICSDICSLQKW